MSRIVEETHEFLTNVSKLVANNFSMNSTLQQISKVKVRRH